MDRKILKKWIALCLLFITVFMVVGCEKTGTNTQDEVTVEETNNKKVVETIELLYAKEFEGQIYEDGYVHIRIADGQDYILVPEGLKDNNLGFRQATYIHLPLHHVYLAASSAMDLFKELDSLHQISTCSTKASDYSIEEAKQLIEAGQIQYVGKYSAPDYESLLAQNTSLAVESTMIYHSPKVKEELERMGIPVLVERSSYESDPLGRLEWIKLYGLLLGKYDEAKEIFDEKLAQMNSYIGELGESSADAKGVVFFYISSNGYVNVRKPGDYVSKMIEMAGGKYLLQSLPLEEENALSTVNISWEDFYLYAKEADILIYNGTIDGGVKTIEELVGKNELFADFKAVKTGQVYCTNKDMYQESSHITEVIQDFAKIMAGNVRDLQYIYPLEGKND